METTTCKHPDHTPGVSCEDRAVGCSPSCECCLGSAMVSHAPRLSTSWTEPQVTIKFPNEASRNAFVTWLKNIGDASFCEADFFAASREERIPIQGFVYSDENVVEQRAPNRMITATLA